MRAEFRQHPPFIINLAWSSLLSVLTCSLSYITDPHRGTFFIMPHPWGNSAICLIVIEYPNYTVGSRSTFGARSWIGILNMLLMVLCTLRDKVVSI